MAFKGLFQPKQFCDSMKTDRWRLNRDDHLSADILCNSLVWLFLLVFPEITHRWGRLKKKLESSKQQNIAPAVKVMDYQATMAEQCCSMGLDKLSGTFSLYFHT